MGSIMILPETTKNPITLMGRRAGCCWNANITDDRKNYKRGMDCIKSGHGRVMEYVNVEMIIDEYSARVIREWYTHLGGSPTRLQASTRYIDYEHGFNYVVPNSIRNNEEAYDVYLEAGVDINLQYHALWQQLYTKATHMLETGEGITKAGQYDVYKLNQLADIITKAQQGQQFTSGLLSKEVQIDIEMKKQKLEIDKGKFELQKKLLGEDDTMTVDTTGLMKALGLAAVNSGIGDE